MSFSVEGLLLLVLILVPGAHARRTALSTTAIPWSESYRSQLQEIVEVLVYSIAVAMASVILMSMVAVAFLGRRDDVFRLLDTGFSNFYDADPLAAASWLIAYFFVALAIAELVGTTRLFTRVRAYVSDLLALRDEDWADEPVWSWAIEQIRGATFNPVTVRVWLSDGAAYVGLLSQWPILADEQASKDFIITSAQRKEPGSNSWTALRSGDDYVLINTADCLGIEMGRYANQPATRWRLDVRRAPAVVLAFVWIGWTTWSFQRLDDLPRDQLVRILLAASGALCVAGLLVVVRFWLLLQSRWDTAAAQRMWALSGLVLIAGIVAYGLGATHVIASAALSIAGFLSVAATLVFFSSSQQQAPPAPVTPTS